MRKNPGTLTPPTGPPVGIGNTSHQICGTFMSIGLWQSVHVLSVLGSITHWTVSSKSGPFSATYLATVLRFELTTFWLGSNTSTIWNGLRWMWNGCEIGGPNV